MNMSSATKPIPLINRREVIRRVSAALGGGAFVGGAGLLAALEKASFPLGAAIGEFTLEDIAFLDEIAETILPATKTPGAKAAKTGAFMALMVTDCYSRAEQKVFREGMRKVDDATRKASQVSFMEAMPQQRTAVLTTLDHEQKRVMDARALQPAHYFRMIKQLALLGYFTSEIGCTQALRYVESPGRFDPCIPYTPGEPAWAAHA
jgi:Gluconate 2-dehydrogenase subunit 3